MEEKKYEVIDPDESKYKLTAADLKKEKKKKNGAVKVLLAIVIILALLVGSGAVFVNSYLSKINYGQMEAEVNPELDKEETVEFEGQGDADNDIRSNLSDSVMWYDDRVYNVLLIGYDFGDIADKYFPRADSIILISVNSINNKINMVSFSRASYVAIEGHGNKRLNTAHAYGGPKLLVDTIQKNYKIRIDKYICVDIAGFENIVDILGGVDINMSAKEARAILGKAAAGTYHLNGDRAVSYSRLRSIDSDRNRTGRQRAVLNAIADKFRHSSVQTMVGLLDDVLPLVTTDFSKTELISQATKVPQYLTMNMNEDIIPHQPHSLSLRDGLEVIILNWAHETAYIHDLLYPGIVPQSAEENK